MANTATTVANMLNSTSNSNSSNESNEMFGAYGSERYLVPTLFALIVILGCVGNVLVLVVILKNRSQFRNTTNLFILNLSIADLLFLVFCIPFHAVIYSSQDQWPFGDFMCRFVHLVQYSSMIGSVYTLVAMATDRFMAVAYALETKHIRTPKVALLVTILIWVISLTISSPMPAFYTVRTYNNTPYGAFHACADDWGSASEYRRTYFLLLFLLTYALPLACIIALTSLMIRQLWLVKGPSGLRWDESRRAKRKVTRLVIVVVIVFWLCWLPNHIVWIWTNYFRGTWKLTYSFYYFRIFAHVLSYANSGMNPILYAFLSRNFRRYFHRAMKCKFEVAMSPSQSTMMLHRTMSYGGHVMTSRHSSVNDHDTSV